MIDSHCHLADPKFAEDLDVVLVRAREAGIEKMVTISDTLLEAEKCLQIAEKYDHIFCTIGVHPHAAKDWKQGDDSRVRQLALSSPKVRAIGEIGLDYHYDFSPRDVQKDVFRAQLSIAKELELPVVVHNRESIADLWPIAQEIAPLRAVLHCCTERWEDVRAWVEAGYFLSFTGIATYAKSEDIRRTIAECPLDQMMIETDAPYLAPVPHRGKRNEPAFVAEVAKCIAEIKGVSPEEIDRATTRNAVEFFSLVPVG